MFFVKILEYMAGMMSMNTHLKGVLGFSDTLDPGFLLIFEIWYYEQKWSGSTLKSMSCQKFQYLQPLVTLWTGVLISNEIIPEKLSI